METKFSRAIPLILLLLAGCSASFNIRDNLAEGQIIDPVVVRKPSLETTLGIFPKYDDYLEGYISGGVVETEGKPLQGATVRITDESGGSEENFEAGVTDQDGMFKVRFSLPIRWNRVDFTGTVHVDSPWKVISPLPQFKIRYSGKYGTLACYAKPMWIPVKNTTPPPSKIEPPPARKKADDAFGEMNFGE